MSPSKPRKRSFRFFVVCLTILLIVWLLSVHRAAQLAYYNKIEQLRYKAFPVSLVDLDAIQRKFNQHAEADFDSLQAKLQDADNRLSGHFTNSELTSGDLAELQLFLDENPDFLGRVLAATKADYYWSRKRFGSLDEVRSEPTDKMTLQARSAARFLQRVSRYSMETGDLDNAMQCTVAMLKLADLLAAQPTIEQCYQSLAVRGMALSSIIAILNANGRERMDAAAIRNAVHSMDADSAYLAMIDTERAIIISTHEAAVVRLWTQYNGVVSLLNFLETGNAPSGLIGRTNFALQNDDLMKHVSTLRRVRDSLTQQEQEIDQMLKGE